MTVRCAACRRFRLRLDESEFCRSCAERVGAADDPLWSNPLVCPAGCGYVGRLLLSTEGPLTATCPSCGSSASGGTIAEEDS